MIGADSIQFSSLVQIPRPNNTGFVCLATSWTMKVIGLPVRGVTASISPAQTGVGSNDCSREDVVNVAVSTDGSQPSAYGADYQAYGKYTLCNPGVNCSAAPSPEIAGEWLIFSGPAPSPSPTPVGTPTGSGNGGTITTPAPTPSALYIYDKNLGKIVSDGQTYNTSVGKQMSLEIGPTPATNPQFTIPGTTIASQTFASATASYQTIASLNVQDLTYYWLAGNFLAVSGSATVGGVQQTAYAVYNVEAPVVSTMSATFASAAIAPSPQPILQLGDLNNLATNPGAKLQMTAQAPPDFSGYFAETQLVKSSPVPSPLSSPPPFSSTGGQYWSDNCAFYMVQVDRSQLNPLLAAAGGTVSFTTYDAPNYVLEPLASLAINDYFKDYLVFRPTGTNNVFVAVQELDWNWGGVATLTGVNTYSLTSPISPASPSNGTPATGYLSWPNSYVGGGDCPTIPTS